MTKCWQHKDARISTTKTSINTRHVKLIAAISEKIGLCWYQLLTGTLNSKIFIDFIRNLLAETGTHVAILMDNASWHTAKFVTKYLRDNNIKYVLSVPYLPQASAIEYWFSVVKHRYRKKKLKALLNGIKPNIEGLIRECVVEVADESAKNFCRHVLKFWQQNTLEEILKKPKPSVKSKVILN